MAVFFVQRELRRQRFASPIFLFGFICRMLAARKMHMQLLATGRLEIQTNDLVAFCGCLAFPSHVH